MLLPIPARVPVRGNGAFGVQRTPTHRHQGIDLGAPEGTPVRAADHGRVVHVVEPGTRGFSGYGATIVIEHARPTAPGKVWTLYAHLKRGSATVRVGQEVSRGDVIAQVGRTCGTVSEPHKLCGGPHLHFEVSKRPYPQASEATRLDPTFFLTAAP